MNRNLFCKVVGKGTYIVGKDTYKVAKTPLNDVGKTEAAVVKGIV
jgi:hypothetical protein